MNTLRKYPRTPHLEGSGLQTGDEDMPVIPLAHLAGCQIVVEEKMDGANCAISFATDGTLRLQSRGHYLVGGPRERQFALFKTWASRYAHDLWTALGDRYILYGEWLYAKHTILYTDLPHYFMEFDLLDTLTGEFMDTPGRQTFLQRVPFVRSVPVLYAGECPAASRLRAMIGHSTVIQSDQADVLQQISAVHGVDPFQAAAETDTSGLMEGLYIKVETGGIVRERFKLVRAGFLQRVLDSGSHWQDRPILPNRLRADVELF